MYATKPDRTRRYAPALGHTAPITVSVSWHPTITPGADWRYFLNDEGTGVTSVGHARSPADAFALAGAVVVKLQQDGSLLD